MFVSRRPIAFLSLLVVSLPASLSRADDLAAIARRDMVRRAVERALPVLQKSARNYPMHKDCFGCHNQTFPLLGMTAAAAAGIETDKELASSITETIHDGFEVKSDDLKAGQKIGGKGLTVGYALWTLRLGALKRDETTDTMVAYLLKVQEADGRWVTQAFRPPGEDSHVTCTVFAANGIKLFAADSQRTAADAAVEKARTWLAQAKLAAHDDRLSRLWGLHLLGGAKEDELLAARRAVLETQRADGGWSQLPEMESDAYATGTALYVLLDTLPSFVGGKAVDVKAAEPKTPLEGTVDGAVQSSPANDDPLSPVVSRAVDWLVKSQLDDGSWHVKTRAKPVQKFFDNGDPHGKDQFISITSTGWAIGALARTLPAAAAP